MEENKSLLELSKEKVTVSARVNKHVAEIYKNKKIPVSLVIEMSLIHFMKLSDKEKIKFISDNLPETVHERDLSIPKLEWNVMLKQVLKKTTIPSTVVNGLFKGLAIGAITVIAGILNTVDLTGDDEFDDMFWDDI
jgi:late competence protein required for DNA uptake (superfamily II DNA/RNA helicase)